MRDETVARNYAETLYELARRNEGVEVYAEGIDLVSTLLDEDPRLRLFFETPRIDAAAKKSVVRKVFGEALPKGLVNFLLIVIDKRRQRLLRRIASEYHALVDEHAGRMHVDVTVARELDDDTITMLAGRIGEYFGKTAIPHVRVKPEILGGVVVQAGDTVFDGSLRRRLGGMRRRLMAAALPADSNG